MSSTAVRPDAAQFVARVRAELDDLSREEVEELTGGLEADLADALADGESPTERFGDPAAYAEELRSAAGLPPKPDGGPRRDHRPSVLARAEADLRRGLADLGSGLDQQGWWPGVRDFLVTLRPVWWVARGWIAYLLVVQVLGGGWEPAPHGPVELLVLLVAVVGSVEIGRRRLAGRSDAWRRLIVAGNVFAVLCVLAVGQAVVASAEAPPYGPEGAYGPPAGAGLWMDGSPVGNVFPYDRDGRPLDGVSLYDAQGRPLDLPAEARRTLDDQGREVEALPAVDADGQQRWNTYPLRQREVPAETTTRDGEPLSGVPSPGDAAPAPLPSLSPAPLLAPSPSPTETPTPAASPSPSPTSAPSPSPTVEPTPTPTPTPTSTPTRTR